MAEEHKEQVASAHEGEGEGEVKDRGLFDFLGKKNTEEKKPAEEEYLAADVQHIHIEEDYKLPYAKENQVEEPQYFFDKEEEKQEEEKKEQEKHHGLLDKLPRSHSSSSSSSSSEEEEVEGEGGIIEKIKKKKKEKALKEKIEEKEHHEEENKKPAYVAAPPVEESVVVVKEELELQEQVAPEEGKKGFLEKIKDKLPGHSKKPTEEGAPAPPADVVEDSGEPGKVHEAAEGTEGKEKKGFLGKIIEKLPGYHHKSTGEEGDKTPASH